MTCFFCGGAAHPATGHAYSETALSCRRCYETFFAWYRARMNHNPIAAAARGDYSIGWKPKSKRGKVETTPLVWEPSSTLSTPPTKAPSQK